jgi:H+/Cl- antiporter ClcA
MARPRRPEPPLLQTHDVLTAVVGTVAWAVALAVLLIVGLPMVDRWWLWVCVVGIVIGLYGIWYIPRLHRSRAGVEARRNGRTRHHLDGNAQNTRESHGTGSRETRETRGT